MSNRIEIVNSAIWESNYDKWKPSTRNMIEMFEVAGLKPPTLRDLRNFEASTGNVLVHGQSIAWCGIFATYVLKKWGGLDVRWVLGKGIRGAGVKIHWTYQGIKPGDVAVVRGKGKNGAAVNHYFIVTHVDYDQNIMHSVDGNSTNNCIVWHTDKKIKYPGADHKYYTPYCHYKLPL